MFGNALFSFISGYLMLVFSDSLISIMNIRYSLAFYWLGGGLILFSLSILPVILFESYKIVGSRLTIIQDLIWVIGSLGMIIWNPFETGTSGLILIFAIATIVLIFAFLQNYYLRELLKSKNNEV